MELLDSCRDYAHKFYRDLMLATEKTLDNALFEMAKNSTNNDDQRRFYEAIQILKNRGGAICDIFSCECLAPGGRAEPETTVRFGPSEQLRLLRIY